MIVKKTVQYLNPTIKDNSFLPVFGEYGADDPTHHNPLGVHAVHQILG